MNKVSNLPDQQRRELFRESAALRGMNPAVVEKDFWVCWVLKQLFSDPELRKHLVFKGGTTLSKVFGLTERFSEDIDLVLDWQLLGLGEGEEDPYQERSRTQRDRFNARVNERAAQYIAGRLMEDLSDLFAVCPEVAASVDSDDAQTVRVAYPAAFSEQYLKPEVVLEIGPLASFAPFGYHEIRPYAAEAFPDVLQMRRARCSQSTPSAPFGRKRRFSTSRLTGSMPCRNATPATTMISTGWPEVTSARERSTISDC